MRQSMKIGIIASNEFWISIILERICSQEKENIRHIVSRIRKGTENLGDNGYKQESHDYIGEIANKYNIPILEIGSINHIDYYNKLRRSSIDYVFCLGIVEEPKDDLLSIENLTFVNLSSDIGQDFSQILLSKKKNCNIFFEKINNTENKSIIAKRKIGIYPDEMATSIYSKIGAVVAEMIPEAMETVNKNKALIEGRIGSNSNVEKKSNLGIHILTEEEKDDWDDFVNSSEQGCIFSSSLWLDTLNMPWKAYCFGNGKRDIRAAILLIFDENNGCIFPDFTPFFSVLLGNIKRTTRAGQEEAIIKNLTPIIEVINRKYKNICVACHPSFIDLRPFLWSTFLEKNPYNTYVRYTYVVNPIENEKHFYEKLDKNVRYSIRMGNEYGFSIIKNKNFDDFLELYIHTFKRQEIILSEKTLNLVKRIYENICLRGNGCLYIAEKESRFLSMCMFIWDKKCSYYLFGANSEEGRKSNVGYALLWEAIKVQLEKGLIVDFVGCNSPDRARFKRRYNGVLTPYYLIQRTTEQIGIYF
jgi:hypothetical protein